LALVAADDCEVFGDVLKQKQSHPDLSEWLCWLKNVIYLIQVLPSITSFGAMTHLL
jgi:hypothetical protein